MKEIKPKCKKHKWIKEYYLATQTGDYICENCGEVISEDTYNFYKKVQKVK